jgi:hypothetical protein
MSVENNFQNLLLIVTTLSIVFIVGFFITMFIIRYEHMHTHISGDNDYDAPQKFHNKNISRVDGLAILKSLLCIRVSRYSSPETGSKEILLLVIIGILAFFVALAENVAKMARVKLRFLGICISMTLGVFIFNTCINSMGIELFDSLF